MHTYKIRITINNSDGDHRYDYSDDFLFDIAEVPKGINTEFRKNLFDAFKTNVKKAVEEWFNIDKESVIDEIDQYGYEYDYENKADEDQSELDYAISNFPARCVSHIPNEIMEHNNFRIAPEVSVQYNSYNDLGFLMDND